MRIKVTGYLDTDDMAPEDYALDHPMGLSSKGYEKYVDELGLDDVTFERVDD